MSLTLTFTVDGKIAGEGIDDIAPFAIRGRFDIATSAVAWTKAYTGSHTVDYAGVYSQRAICGDWTLIPLTGGFWNWPASMTEPESAEVQLEIELPLEVA